MRRRAHRSRLPYTLLAALVAGPLTAPDLAAQATLRGVVKDLIVRDGPLSGAEVMVLGTSLTTLTNDKGEYSLTVPAGRHTVVAVHPLLDTLALGEIEMDVEIAAADTEPLDLLTPTLAEYQMDRCGRELPAAEGILLGIVSTADGSPAFGTALKAHWGVRRLTYRSSEFGTDSARVVSDSSGVYIMCGVPRGDAAVDAGGGFAAVRGRVILAVTRGPMSAGPLMLEPMTAAVARRDLVVGPRAASATLTGRLLTESGESVVGARISSRTDSTVTTLTDSLGRFRLRVPRRTDQLMVRAIGRMPLQVEIGVREDLHDLGDVPMPEAAQRLDAVQVTSTALSPERKEFDERRATGLGSFIDDEELRRAPMITTALVSMRLKGAEVVQVAPGERRLMFRRQTITGPGYCDPRFFLDGSDVGPMTGSEQETFLRDAVRIEAYSAAQAPSRYNDFDGCGVVLIWTR